VTLIGLTLASTTLAAPEKKAAPKTATAAKKPTPAKPHAEGDVTRVQMIAQVKKTFDMADTNHDGFMSRAEFAARMGAVVNREAPPTKEDAQRMLDAANHAFNDVDANHDGKLSLAEAMKRPLKAFDMMDTNHDGVLTVAEKAAAHQNAPALPNGPTQGEMQGPGR
jgi:Ca2+-binding EF-hand superfamily protein